VADGGVVSYMGTYADFVRAKANAIEPAMVTTTERPRPAQADQDPAARRRLSADLREAERRVTVAEERLRAVEAALSDPSSHSGDFASLGRQHSTLLEEVSRLTAKWTELAEAAEGAA
jgi:hypothetical protein